MSAKYGIIFSFFLFMLVSCANKEQFPAKFFENVSSEMVVLNRSFLSSNETGKLDSLQLKRFTKELIDLSLYKQFYDEKNVKFSLADLESSWNNLKTQRKNFDFESVKQWIEISGFLLEITGNALYAQELEETVFQGSTAFSKTEFSEIENLITPWIFTKNVDHIHVNLFTNATIKYEHTLKGAVEITAETEYPKSGKIQIRFKMGEKRLIELFIRIPDWADGATVTEKGVKYVATPGRYCQIVRKWSEGDFVEISLPTEQMPKR